MLLVAVAIPLVLAFVLFGVASAMDRWLDRPFMPEFEKPSLAPRMVSRAEDDLDAPAVLLGDESPPAAAAGS
jgi:hypothetical protein